jgi:type II secretory pathway pseudopilin PulG
MKTFPAACRRSRRRAFTLVEIMIAMVTSITVMGGALAAYLYALNMVKATQPKLTASDEARKAHGQFTADVRSAFSVRVGDMAGGTFTPAKVPGLQTGNALRIYPTTNTNAVVFYVLDPSRKTLRREARPKGGSVIVATGVTNTVAFTAENYRGIVCTNEIDNFVVGLTLQFDHINQAGTKVAEGSYYDWYQLRAKATRRTLF